MVFVKERETWDPESHRVFAEWSRSPGSSLDPQPPQSLRPQLIPRGERVFLPFLEFQWKLVYLKPFLSPGGFPGDEENKAQVFECIRWESQFFVSNSMFIGLKIWSTEKQCKRKLTFKGFQNFMEMKLTSSSLSSALLAWKHWRS